MRTIAINNINFGNKKFRLPVRIIKQNAESTPYATDSLKKDKEIYGNFVREYDNPKAEELFYKALETTNLEEKFKLLSEMGDYKIVNIEKEQSIDNFMKGIDKLA